MNTWPAPPSVRERNSMAETSFVLGVIALVAVVVPLGLFIAPVCGALAVVFGVWGRVRAGQGLGGGDRATVGVVLGAISVILSSTALYLLRHVITRVFSEITIG